MNLVVTGGVDPRHIFPQMFFLADAPWPKEFPARAVKGAAWREDDRAVLGRKFSMISYPVIPNLKKKETCSLNPNFCCEINSIQHGTDCRLSQTGRVQRIQKGHHWVQHTPQKAKQESLHL